MPSKNVDKLLNLGISLNNLCVGFGLFLLSLFIFTGCVPYKKKHTSFTQTPNTKVTTQSLSPIAKSTLIPRTLVVNSSNEVSGYVVNGGDTTPAGLIDVPRIFEYQINTDDGLSVNLTYTAFPPLPSGNLRQKLKLIFHAGEILIGDYIQARGTYSEETRTLTVAEEGDYIQTFPEKP